MEQEDRDRLIRIDQNVLNLTGAFAKHVEDDNERLSVLEANQNKAKGAAAVVVVIAGTVGAIFAAVLKKFIG